ncbi:hypothetical protein HMPREF1862_00778 [Varibaculum cambriense]|uniref:Uncharacterized protein n=1 Tax=Varibaculum cambriense TaxID=184870 RepID=A0AB34WZX2_9ACTO|nr:hypothetical protein HMPREF1862_00778 [Varibaculum cambriense]PMB90303.1 hypothetical protein CJ240_00725 [Varibaculum cambriense]
MEKIHRRDPLFTFCGLAPEMGAGSVKALRGPHDLLRRSSPCRIFYRPRPQVGKSAEVTAIKWAPPGP